MGDDVQKSFSVLILAGGRSRRMGSDKASLLLHGEPLLARAVRRLSTASDDLLVAMSDAGSHRAIVPDTAVRFVTDLHPGAGPLAGLEAGLSAARHELLLMVAVDMPFASAALARGMADLASGYDVVLPFSPAAGGSEPRPEPLHALYRRTCLPIVTASLEAGERQVVAFFPQVLVRELPPATVHTLDPSGLAFTNANTPADWEKMLALSESD